MKYLILSKVMLILIQNSTTFINTCYFSVNLVPALLYILNLNISSVVLVIFASFMALYDALWSWFTNQDARAGAVFDLCTRVCANDLCFHCLLSVQPPAMPHSGPVDWNPLNKSIAAVLTVYKICRWAHKYAVSLSQRQIAFFGTFRVKISFWTQRQSF